MAEALYRKYRPQTFEDVVGQEHIERTIRNAINSDKVSHAYLFTGPRGTGKTTTARLLAKALLCESGPTPDPDGTCEDCNLIALGEHPDVYELDAASRTGVENVREEIISRVNYAPTRGRYKVYIIDEVHMLSIAAFNALLKTLEEPPAHVVFVLCTTDPQKVPETIHSRCQRFDFKRISSEELISRLGYICGMEGVEFEGDALELVAHRAEGGMRDALTSLEQLIAFSDGSITMSEAERLLGTLDSTDLADIVSAIGKRDAAACFNWTSEYMESGADLAQFAKDLAEHIRDMYVMTLAGADVALDISESARREIQVELQWYGQDRLARMLSILGDLIADLKTSTNQRLSFEIAITRMIRPDSDLTLESLAERVEALERGLPADRGANIQGVVNGKDAEPKRTIDESEPKSISKQVDEGAAAKSMPTNGASDDTSIRSGGDVVSQWDAVLGYLKKISEPYNVMFMNTKPLVDDEELIVEFIGEKDFTFKALQKPEAKDALKQALERYGFKFSNIRIVKANEASEPKAARSKAPSANRTSEDQPVRDDHNVGKPSQATTATDRSVAAGASTSKVEEETVVDMGGTSGQSGLSDSGDPSDRSGLSDSGDPSDPGGSESNILDMLSDTFGDDIIFEEVD